jgi:glutamine cyclotransferase
MFKIRIQHSTITLIGLIVLSIAQVGLSGEQPQAVQPSPAVKELSPPISPKIYHYKIVKTYPHDDQAFTQGLIYENNFFYEGTGLYGRSALRKTALESGAVLKSRRLPVRFFGEGITAFRGKVVQLTWKSRTGFVYEEGGFQLLRTFSYKTEGWGLTHDASKLIMSDGSAHLIFLDPETFAEIRRLKVFDDKGPVTGLNELEYVRGEIFANVWPTNLIAIISPVSGRVTGWIDLAGLSRLSGGDNINKTLNGIAYDKDNDRLFVTGKLWPRIYEIKLIPLTPDA